MRKAVFKVFDQVQNKPGCTTTEDGLRLEISDLESSGIVLPVDCTMYVVKTKPLISSMVTAQLI